MDKIPEKKTLSEHQSRLSDRSEPATADSWPQVFNRAVERGHEVLQAMSSAGSCSSTKSAPQVVWTKKGLLQKGEEADEFAYPNGKEFAHPTGKSDKPQVPKQSKRKARMKTNRLDPEDNNDTFGEELSKLMAQPRQKRLTAENTDPASKVNLILVS